MSLCDSYYIVSLSKDYKLGIACSGYSATGYKIRPAIYRIKNLKISYLAIDYSHKMTDILVSSELTSEVGY